MGRFVEIMWENCLGDYLRVIGEFVGIVEINSLLEAERLKFFWPPVLSMASGSIGSIRASVRKALATKLERSTRQEGVSTRTYDRPYIFE